MNRSIVRMFCLLALTALISGCQSGIKNPLEPPGSQLSRNTPMLIGSRMSMGLYTVTIDKENLTADVQPLRSGSLHVNVTGVLNVTMGLDVKMVPGESDPAHGLFVMDISLTHPFGTKPQLAGFDVKGIVMTPGSLSIGPLVFADYDQIRLENADGYTRWWNPTEFTSSGMFGYTQGNLASAPSGLLTATINPYKYFADILYPASSLAAVADAPLDDDNGRGVFTTGSTNTRRYEMRFPMSPGPQVVFGYAIDASWAPPVPNPPSAVPDDFPMEANQPEPWRVKLTEKVNNLYYDPETGAAGGVLRYEASVYDWQGMAAGDIENEIEVVRFYSPDLMEGSLDADYQSENFKAAKYTVDLTDATTPTGPGEALVVCRVASTDGSTYDQVGAPAPDAPLSAFQVMTVEISDPECEGDANNDFIDAFDINAGDVVTDQVCLPDDYRDFYRFVIPNGFLAEGSIQMYCDAGSTSLSLYDSDQSLLDQEDFTDGHFAIELGKAYLPGVYFIRVNTNNPDVPVPYVLEMTCELVDVSPHVADVTPPWLFCKPYNMWLHENHLYMVGQGAWVYDLTDPADPQFVSYIPISNLWSDRPATFRYPYCYFVRDDSGPDASTISMLDFTDPAAPVLHEDIITSFLEIQSMCMNSQHLFIGTEPGINPNIIVYDYASSPEAPTNLGTTFIVDDPVAMDLLDPEGPDTELVIGTPTRLYAYDVESPPAFTASGDIGLPADYTLNDLVTNDGFVFVVDANADSDGWLNIYEKTGSDFFNRGEENLSGGSLFIEYDDGRVYVGDGSAGMSIVDISDPLAPILIGNFPLASAGLKLTARDGLVVIHPKYAGFQVFDTTPDGMPSFISKPIFINHPRIKIFFEGDYMFVGDWTPPSGVRVVDISDPANARIVASTNVTTVDVDHLTKYGDLIAIGGYTEVAFLNAADPLNMLHYLNVYDSGGPLLDDIILKEDALYFIYNDSGKVIFRVIDVSDPGSPSDSTTFWYNGVGFRQATLYGDVMYIPTADGVRIYTTSTPKSPNFIGTYTTSSAVNITQSQGAYLYLWQSSIDIIEILDITNPFAPVQAGLGAAGTISSADMAIDGQYAYFSGNDPSIKAARVWPLDDITPLGTVYPHPHAGYELYSYDGYLYKITLGSGIAIFDLHN